MKSHVADLTVDEFRRLVSETVRESVEDAVEDLAALQSPEYIRSIQEAREDYKQGRVKPLDDLSHV